MDDTTSTQPSTRSTEQGGSRPDHAAGVAGTAPSSLGDHAADVRDTVAEQAGQVTQDAKAHASRLLESSKEELRSQSDIQAAKVAEGLRSLSSELGSMADATSQPGPLADVTREAGQRVGELADRLAANGLQGVVDELGSMARRRPGSFLLGALASGFVAGRLARTAQTVMSDGSDTRRAGEMTSNPAAATRQPPINSPYVDADPRTIPPARDFEPSMASAGVAGSRTSPER